MRLKRHCEIERQRWKTTYQKENFPPIRYFFSDAEVQTTNSPHRVLPYRATIGEEQSLINTPFIRDPNVPVQCPLEEVSHRNSNSFNFQLDLNKHDFIKSSNSRISYSVSPRFITFYIYIIIYGYSKIIMYLFLKKFRMNFFSADFIKNIKFH